MPTAFYRPAAKFSGHRHRRLRAWACLFLVALWSALCAGCGEIHHELRPPSNVADIIADPALPLPAESPPVPEDMQPFERDWLYCIFPRTHVVTTETVSPTGLFYTVGFGPDPTPKALPNAAPPPADPATPPTPPTPAAPASADAARTTARLIVLPGFPGDACDRNINGGSSLRATMGDVYSAVFGGMKFEQFVALPLEQLPPRWSQAWKVTALDGHGRCEGFIVRSANHAAWGFGLCYAEPGNGALRDALLARLDLRLGADQQFNNLFSDYRIDSAIPADWHSPGASEQSRRWDAPGKDSHAFFVISDGAPAGNAICLECTSADALRELQRFPELKDHPHDPSREESRLLAPLWASCGIAEVKLDTTPRQTTLGAWVFYDPIARKRFSVYYGYQLAAEKAAIDGMLARLTRVSSTAAAVIPAPEPPPAPAPPPEIHTP